MLILSKIFTGLFHSSLIKLRLSFPVLLLILSFCPILLLCLITVGIIGDECICLLLKDPPPAAVCFGQFLHFLSFEKQCWFIGSGPVCKFNKMI